MNPQHLQAAVHEMRHKAPGPDDWEPQALQMLPAQLWFRLCQVLDTVEETSAWPQGLRSWRVCFIPNTSSNGICDTLKTRPIAVGAIIYRAWARVRFKEAAALLPQSVLGTLQVGGLKTHDAETILLTLDQESAPQSHPFGMSLDFEKAFDSTDWELAWALMYRCGIAPNILRGLRAMWSQRMRWVTYGRCVDPRPFSGAPALLQGDSWAPFAMALVLAGPYKQSRLDTPRACQTLYLDDRTAYHKSVQDLLRWRATWRSFESKGRLKTHEGKTQVWARSQKAFQELSQAGLNPSLSLLALGVSLGKGSQEPEKEQQRKIACEQRALRIGLLPCSAKLKQHLAATVVSPMF